MTSTPFQATGRSPGTPAETLFCIVYVSTAAKACSLPDLLRLAAGARRHNEPERVTGVLLCAASHFMQYLEGPAPGLARVYERIKADPMHYALIDLVREPIPAREFADWSMALHLPGGAGAGLPVDDRLAARLALADEPVAPARAHLSNFCRRGGSAVSLTLANLSDQRARRVRAGYAA
jgi:hypothetical protein